jgi:hypothetical protein
MMRKFWFGLLIGVAVVWAIIRWRRGQGLPWWYRHWEMGEPMRIPLPEEPVPEPEAPTEEPTAEAPNAAASGVLAQVQALINGGEPLEAYCARCQAQRPMANPEPAVTSDGRAAVRGQCAECGARVFRFVKV